MKSIFKAVSMTTAVIALSTTISFASDLSGVVKSGETALGNILTDTAGMTLYTFDKDANGKSACNGGCAKAWPPLLVKTKTPETGDYTKITRDDGNKQWAYKGKPLYGWVKDTKPGDVTGDKFKGVWHIVKP
ncbi:hypothetical protein [Kiloniella sp.]|uniref:COG4315 family predicted lipoprotein n=1 Tax=Kiloniella sp. TaxID=1938587 RepID=UPI003B02AE48